MKITVKTVPLRGKLGEDEIRALAEKLATACQQLDGIRERIESAKAHASALAKENKDTIERLESEVRWTSYDVNKKEGIKDTQVVEIENHETGWKFQRRIDNGEIVPASFVKMQPVAQGELELPDETTTAHLAKSQIQGTDCQAVRKELMSMLAAAVKCQVIMPDRHALIISLRDFLASEHALSEEDKREFENAKYAVEGKDGEATEVQSVAPGDQALVTAESDAPATPAGQPETTVDTTVTTG